MRGDADTNYFPYILGGVVLVAGAVLAAIALIAPANTNPFTRPAEPPMTMPNRGAANASVAVALPTAPPVSPAPVAAPATSALTGAGAAPTAGVLTGAGAARAVRPALPPGQVYQCTTHGQKTFSDSPCGADASVRQLNPVNGMEPTTASPRVPVYSYGPYRTPGMDYGSPPPAEQDAPDSGGNADSDGDVYAGAPAILFNERSRHVHRPRPHPHPHPRSHGPDR